MNSPCRFLPIPSGATLMMAHGAAQSNQTAATKSTSANTGTGSGLGVPASTIKVGLEVEGTRLGGVFAPDALLLTVLLTLQTAADEDTTFGELPQSTLQSDAISLEILRRKFLGSTLDVVSLQAAGAKAGERVRARLRIDPKALAQIPAAHADRSAAGGIKAQASSGAPPPETRREALTEAAEADKVESSSSAALPAPGATASGLSAQDAVQAVRAALFDEDARSCLRTVVAVLDNATKHPADPVKRCLRLSNPAVQRKIGQFASAVALLESAGFLQKGSGSSDHRLELPLGGQSQFAIDATRIAVVASLAQLGVTTGPPPDAPAAASSYAVEPTASAPQIAFDPFKPALTRLVPQATRRGVSTGTVDLSGDGTRTQGAGRGNVAGSKDATESVTKRETRSSVDSQEMTGVEERAARLQAERDNLIPDSMEGMRGIEVLSGGVKSRVGGGSAAYLTEAAARAALKSRNTGDGNSILASLKRKRMQQERSFELRLRADREMEQLRMGPVFRWANLSVLLPGGVEIKGRFSPRETIGAVRAMARTCIAASHRDALMELFTPMPRKVYADDETILNAGLVPAARLRARFPGCDDPTSAIDPEQARGSSPTEEHPNSQAIPVDAFVGRLPSGGYILFEQTDEVQAGGASEEGPGQSDAGSASREAGAGAASGGGGEPKRVPRWLKPS